MRGSTAPASATSIDGDRSAGGGTTAGTAAAGAATISTRPSRDVATGRISRRHANTCRGQTCQRRATSATTAPGASVSITIRAMSASDHFRRRPGPVRVASAEVVEIPILIGV
jgi:hypothetical protein